MDINEIKDIVEENYGINIKSISKVKNSYNVNLKIVILQKILNYKMYFKAYFMKNHKKVK